MRRIRVQCINVGQRANVNLALQGFVASLLLSKMTILNAGRHSPGGIQMIVFFLSLTALGIAGAVVIREVAAIQAKQRAALRPVRIQSTERGADRSARRRG
jgi:hypothetical protein